MLLGGARSGKSAYAQALAVLAGSRVLFCATAEALDGEMRARIEKHRKSRPAHWETLEASKNTGRALAQIASKYDAIILDCITILVANIIGDGAEAERAGTAVDSEIIGLIELLELRQSNYILVSNEAGSGIVPDNRLGRLYRDELGRANQKLAAISDDVYLLTAGIPLKLK